MDHFRCDVQRRNLGGIHLLRNTLHHLAVYPICTGSMHPSFWLISIRHVQSLRWNSEETLSSYQTIPTGPGWKWRQHLHRVPWQGRKYSHIAVRTWQVLSRLRPQMPERGGFWPKVSRVSRSHRACLEISLSYLDKCRSNHLCGWNIKATYVNIFSFVAIVIKSTFIEILSILNVWSNEHFFSEHREPFEVGGKWLTIWLDKFS